MLKILLLSLSTQYTVDGHYIPSLFIEPEVCHNKTSYCIKPEERIHLLIVYRAYPGSEFVVANTLAKWKKLEPNEGNFSQGLSQKY